MSLVAYAASSGEESENEEEPSESQVQLLKPILKSTNSSSTNNDNRHANIASTNGHISDDDDDYIPQEVSLQELKPPANGRLMLSLPKPKAAIAPTEEEDEELPDEQVAQAFAKLPMPRTATSNNVFIAEEDDEFLHKKAIPTAGSENLEKPPAPAVKTRVKISIPSLREFADVDKEKAEKQQLQKGKQTGEKPKKGSSLLSILPQAKSERDFAKKPDPLPAKTEQNSVLPTKSVDSTPKATPAFVPDSVKQRRAAHNTEGVDGVRVQSSKSTPKPAKQTVSLVTVSDSEDDEDSAGDFFSLNSEEKLPEVSSNEVSALVAKRAAKMVEASNKYLTEVSKRDTAEDEAAQLQAEELHAAQKRYHEQQLNTEAMDALVGKNAKRRRKEAKEMQVIDISGTQVMPDREEWMRTALASATTYQPTGVLTDEEPVAGTRRKHQITYLAHKAKANEAELQAMWSANRQTRRATQSKYGF